MTRHERRAEEERALAEHPAVVQIRPPADVPVIGRVERDPQILRRAVDCGRAVASAALGRAAVSAQSA
jgi:hypothetical protein